jgi:hypothetical protein
MCIDTVVHSAILKYTHNEENKIDTIAFCLGKVFGGEGGGLYFTLEGLTFQV